MSSVQSSSVENRFYVVTFVLMKYKRELMRLSRRDPVAMDFKFSWARQVLERAISYGQNTHEPCSHLALKSFLSDLSSAPQVHVFPPGINICVFMGSSKFSDASDKVSFQALRNNGRLEKGACGYLFWQVQDLRGDLWAIVSSSQSSGDFSNRTTDREFKMSQFIGNGYDHLCNSISKYHDPKICLGVVCLKKWPYSNKGFLKTS